MSDVAVGTGAAVRRHLSARLAGALTNLCAMLVAGIVLVMLADVAGRNLLGVSIPSTAEIAVLMQIYVVFIGMAVGVQRGMHFVIFDVRRRYPPAVVRACEVGVRAVVVVFCGVLGVYGVRMGVAQMGQLSATMQIPYGFFYFAVPVGSVFAIAFALLEPLDRTGPTHEVLM
jgi:TRAP-type C4-dicarboxylate transport system permease small subunit